MNQSDFFVTGGALLADAGSYVERAADTMLIEALRAGEFCYVLTTRQMGKTSLTVRTAAQLRAEGWAVVVLDLTAFGQNLDVEQWYFSMLSDVAVKLKLEEEMESHWEANVRRAPLHRFMGAIRDVYLERCEKPLAIFVDEIDVVRSLRQFKADEFFAGIRECYNRRSEDPRLQRLTFCLLGVATPSDLISDQRMTPFNIGRGIELSDFTPYEAAVLGAGLSPSRETALGLLERVLMWTGGHPYLTQRLCAEVAKAGLQTPSAVDGVCTLVFLSADAQSRDENLQFVRERLLRSELDPAAVLDAYARVCRGERFAYDDHNALHNELRLSGIVRVVNGRVEPRNRIYSRVFDLKWVRANLPEQEEQRQRAAFWRGVRRVAAGAIAVLAVMGTLAVQAKRNADTMKVASEREQSAAKKENATAQRAKDAARREQNAAAQAREAAAQARDAAETARRAAERERKANEDRLIQAEQTERTLKRLVDTQVKVAALLEALTPLVGQKGGKDTLGKAEELVSSLSNEPGDDPRIHIGLAGVRRVCGRLYLRLGEGKKAFEQAEEARKLVHAELSRPRAADDSSAKLDSDGLKKLLYECHLLVGDVLIGGPAPQGIVRKPEAEYAKAMKVFEDAAQLARTESAARPQDAKWRELYFSSLMKLSDTAKQCGREEEARKRLVDALAVLRTQREKLREARDLDWIEARLHDQLGTLYLNNDQPEKARAEFDRGLQLREAGTSDGVPEDPERLSDIAQSFNKLGNLAMDVPDWKTALTYHRRSLGIRRRLHEQNPRLDWARNLGFSLSNVAQSLWRSGQEKEAFQHYAERLKLAEELVTNDPADANLNSDHANALLGYADILLNAKDTAVQNWTTALEMARNAVTRTERRDPRLLSLLAQALRLNNFPVEALSVAEEAAKLLPPEDKRSKDDRQTASEVSWEISRSRTAVSSLAKNGKPKARSPQKLKAGAKPRR